MSKEHLVELPHGATLNMRDGILSLTFGMITIKMSIEEFDTFLNEAGDIANYLNQIVTYENEECPSCGTSITYMNAKIPTEEDFN